MLPNTYHQILKEYKSLEIRVLDFTEEFNSKTLENCKSCRRMNCALNMPARLSVMNYLQTLKNSGHGLGTVGSLNSLQKSNISQEVFNFLDGGFDHSFCELDQEILQQFFSSKAANGTLPLLTRWVRISENRDFRIFIIQQIARFKQVGCSYILMQILLKEQDIVVKVEIIKTLAHIQYDRVVLQFIKIFQQEAINIQQELIKAIIKLKSEIGIRFLTKYYEESQPSDIRDFIRNSLMEYQIQQRIHVL
ncbi:hypothetical protein SAMN05421877_10673 [Sphingobacterium lactis]|uniref:HEAT repeat-containing protein n=2 Tax=Sphingobacterium lactis TaxID=797291 RepID=A0A1H5YNU2_9SPHI|nr:hypothetical protein SAMN05421877_10673 [Sphingobacterium lactis]